MSTGPKAKLAKGVENVSTGLHKTVRMQGNHGQSLVGCQAKQATLRKM